MRTLGFAGGITILLAAACASPRTEPGASGGTPPGAMTALGCTGCHGNATSGNAAPPVSVRGATATTDRAVGAHQQHLTTGAVRAAVDCSECHVVPTATDPTAHVDGTALVNFGPLARKGGVSPSTTVSADGSTLTCTTYCHGASLGSGNGSNHAPSWTRVDGSQAGCGTCHGVPPPSPHPAVANGLLGCGSCHPGTVRSDGTIDLAGGLHVDGKVDVAGAACTSCHGDANRSPASIAAAPPVGSRGETATTTRAVGAHQAHLVAGNVAPPVACTECHVLPTNLTNHPNGTATITFGAFSSTGGVTPLWSGTTCTTYCHGASLPGGNATQPTWTLVDGSQRTCGSCHGAPPAAASGHPSVGTALTGCAACHPDTVNADGSINVAAGKHIDGVVEVSGQSCTSCHGDATRTPPSIAAAPPKDTQGNTATTAAGVGAHQRHLTGGSIRGAVACTDCHTVPGDTAHASQPLDLTWSALARASGTTPTWNATSLTCTNYCHGASLPGGSLTAPVWTAGSSQAACGTCHALPPPVSSSHPAVGSALTGCATCHPDTVNADGTINVAGGKHIDGTVEVAGASCTSCHGDATRTPASIAAAPPRDTKGNTATTAAGVGAHQQHLVGGSIRAAVACTDCHTVPDDTAHAAQPLVLTWSALASASGTTPTWNATALTCTNYCHGASLPGGSLTAPVWTAGASQAACGTCHGIPPPAASGHPSVGTATTVCAGCHPDTVNANGTINVAGGKHINGILEVTGTSCTSCHGDPTRTPAAIAPAPPKDTKGNTATTAAGVGAHQKHLLGGTMRVAMACTDCHTVPSDLTHASQPLNLTWSTLATTGTSATWDATTLTCTNYCHGKTLVGGTDTTPVWTSGPSQGACGTCHGLPPSTGHHGTHVSRNVACGTCHGSAYSTTTVDTTVHVNGVKNIAAGTPPGWNPTTRSCANSCHSTEYW